MAATSQTSSDHEVDYPTSDSEPMAEADVHPPQEQVAEVEEARRQSDEALRQAETEIQRLRQELKARNGRSGTT